MAAINAGGDITAAILCPQAWIPITFANSWSNLGAGFVTAQYRLWLLRNVLEVVGHVIHASVSGTSTFSATLVAPYVPVSTQARAVEKVVATSGTFYAATTSGPFLTLTSGGLLQFQFLPLGTTEVEFGCTFYMDA